MNASSSLGSLLPFAVIIGVVAFIVVIVYVLFHHMRKKMEPLALALGGEVKRSESDGTHALFFREGLECRAGIEIGTDKTPPHLGVRIMMAMGFTIYLTKEDPLTRKLMEWGIGRDVQTGDAEFDRAFNVQSSDESASSRILLDREKREAIALFFQENFDLFQVKEDSVYVRKPYYDASDLAPEKIEEWTARLIKIAR